MTRRVLIMFVILLVIAAGLGWYAYHLKKRVALEEQRLHDGRRTIAEEDEGSGGRGRDGRGHAGDCHTGPWRVSKCVLLSWCP